MELPGRRSATERSASRLDRKNLNWEGEDRAVLALFVALLKTRNPAFDKDHNELSEELHRWWSKATHSSPESCEESIRQYEEETGEDMTDVSAQELFEMIRDDQYEIKNPRQNRIKMMMSVALEVAKAVFRLNWEILSAPKDCSFVTCDNPFTVVPPPFFDDRLEGYGIMTSGASTVIPLSGKTAISFYGEGDRVRGAIVLQDVLAEHKRGGGGKQRTIRDRQG